MSTIVQSLTVQVPANLQAWTPSGMVVNAGENIQFSVQNYVFNDISDRQTSFAEGAYNPPDDKSTTKAETLGEVITYGDWGSLATRFTVYDTSPQGLSALILPLGEEPPAMAAGSVTSADDVIRVTRDLLIPASALSGQIWLAFVDILGAYANNQGSFQVGIQRIVDEPLTIDIGQPSPLRFVPPGILQMKQGGSQFFNWCLSIKDRNGNFEGFSDYDLPLSLPEYSDDLGNTIPAMVYQPAAAEISNLAVELKLGAKSVDLKVIAPRRDSLQYAWMRTFYFDRDRLEKGFYEGAEWELFEVSPVGNRYERLIWQCGQIGNVAMDDLTATLELNSYDEVANRTVGWIYHPLCHVGSSHLPNDRFGDGFCRNMILEDGPLRADWTVLATVEAPITWNKFRLSYGTEALSGEDLPAEFADRLSNGDAEFINDAAVGGNNWGYKASLKGGELIEPGLVEVTTKLSLPYLPVEGDQLHLVAGCGRTYPECVFFHGGVAGYNFRGQPLPSEADLLRRTRV